MLLSLASVLPSCGSKEEVKDNVNAQETQQVAQDQKMAGQAEQGTVDIDKWLDDYEKFLDEVLPLAQKAKAGDAAAVQELQKITAKASEFYSQTQKVGAKFTPAQADRAFKLTERINNILNVKDR